jgi:hypothetical protein
MWQYHISVVLVVSKVQNLEQLYNEIQRVMKDKESDSFVIFYLENQQMTSLDFVMAYKGDDDENLKIVPVQAKSGSKYPANYKVPEWIESIDLIRGKPRMTTNKKGNNKWRILVDDEIKAMLGSSLAEVDISKLLK